MSKKQLLKVAKPILFNTAMVTAILEGRKTVTRRCVKFIDGKNPNWTGYVKDGLMLYNGTNEPCCKNSPYKVGDILYVRETWSKDSYRYMYRANYSQNEKFYQDGKEVKIKWKPSIHMPKEAARIFLKVKDIRVERLQDITEEQALREGVPDDTDYPISEIYCPKCHGEGLVGALSSNLGYMEVDCTVCNTAIKRFKHLWNFTIKKDDIDTYGWDASPYVWVIEFEKIEVE